MTERKSPSRSTEAALWALSSGTCYWPGCTAPVVVELSAGKYRKNAQLAHIYGVNGPRRNPTLEPRDCTQFANLIRLCYPHHQEVDDPATGARDYPPEKLFQWKRNREGASGPTLARIGPVDEDFLTVLLTEYFAPPIKRLESIAAQLERTGQLTSESLDELRSIIDVMRYSRENEAHATAALLYNAAVKFEDQDIGQVAADLLSAASKLEDYR